MPFSKEYLSQQSALAGSGNVTGYEAAAAPAQNDAGAPLGRARALGAMHGLNVKNVGASAVDVAGNVSGATKVIGGALVAAPGVLWQKMTGGDPQKAWGAGFAKEMFRQAPEDVANMGEISSRMRESAAGDVLRGAGAEPRAGETQQDALMRVLKLGKTQSQSFQNWQRTTSDIAATLPLAPEGGIEAAGSSLFGKLAPAAERIAARTGGDAALKGASLAARGLSNLGTQASSSLAARAAGGAVRAGGWAARQSLEGATMGAEFSGMTGQDPYEAAKAGAILGPGFAIAGKGLSAAAGAAKTGFSKVVDAGAEAAARAKLKGMGIEVPPEPVVKRAAPKTGQRVAAGTSAGRTMQSVAKMDPSAIVKFTERHGMTPGDFMVSRGLVGTADDVAAEAFARFHESKAAVDSAMEAISGQYKNPDLSSMAREAFKLAKKTSSVTGPDASSAARLGELSAKADARGLTMSEINEVKRYFERNVKTGYLKEQNSVALQRATNLDSAVREFQMGQAEKSGFGNLREMNKQTQAYRAIADEVGSKMVRRETNNNVSLTDYLTMLADPRAALVKMAAKGLKIDQRALALIAKAKQRLGHGPESVADVRPDMGSIGTKSEIQDARSQFARQAEEAKAAEAAKREAALKGPLFQPSVSRPRFQEGGPIPGEAEAAKSGLLSALDRQAAAGRPSPAPSGGAPVTSREAPGFFDYKDADVVHAHVKLLEDAKSVNPHERVASALLGAPKGLPMLPYRGTEMPRAPEAAMNKQGVIALPESQAKPKFSFAKKAEPADVDALKAKEDALLEQVGASRGPAQADTRRRLSEVQSKIRAAEPAGKPAAAEMKKPTPEEQKRIDAIKLKFGGPKKAPAVSAETPKISGVDERVQLAKKYAAEALEKEPDVKAFAQDQRALGLLDGIQSSEDRLKVMKAWDDERFRLNDEKAKAALASTDSSGTPAAGEKFTIRQTLSDGKKTRDFINNATVDKVDEKFVHYTDEDGKGMISLDSFKRMLDSGEITKNSGAIKSSTTVRHAETKPAEPVKKEPAGTAPTFDEYKKSSVDARVARTISSMEKLENGTKADRDYNKRFYDYWKGKSEPEIREIVEKNWEADATRKRKDYIDHVRDLMKKGYEVPQAAYEGFPSLKKAVTDYERYLKGWDTSFKNRSDVISESGVKGFKLKRQDGNVIEPAQAKEIMDSLAEFEHVHGDIKDVLEKLDLTVAHTSGKRPFLKDSGGLYHGAEKTITVGVGSPLNAALGKNDTIKAFAHELTHALDDGAGEMSREWSSAAGKYDRSMLDEARKSMTTERFGDIRLKESKNLSDAEKAEMKRRKITLGEYWNRPNEIFARLVEQYTAMKLGERVAQGSEPFKKYVSSVGYWSKEAIEALAPKIEAEMKRKLQNIRDPQNRKVAGLLSVLLGIPAVYSAAQEAPEQKES